MVPTLDRELLTAELQDSGCRVETSGVSTEQLPKRPGS